MSERSSGSDRELSIISGTSFGMCKAMIGSLAGVMAMALAIACFEPSMSLILMPTIAFPKRRILAQRIIEMSEPGGCPAAHHQKQTKKTRKCSLHRRHVRY